MTENKNIMKQLKFLTNRHTTRDQENSKEILQALGLPGDTDQEIDMHTFRRVITKNLDVDQSFLFKRLFNAIDTERKGYMTTDQFISLITTLLHGPFHAQVALALRVYDKTGKGETLTENDAINCIVDALQYSSPRSRHTLTCDNLERSREIASDLVGLIFPKIDVDGNGIISIEEYTTACIDDPTLVQSFGQFLPVDCVIPYEPEKDYQESLTKLERPRSRSFEGIDYLTHSPTMSSMWGKKDGHPLERRASDRLVPIRSRESLK